MRNTGVLQIPNTENEKLELEQSLDLIPAYVSLFRRSSSLDTKSSSLDRKLYTWCLEHM
jgi:hypothetical protein